ncbi:hypothetical protein GOBAR_AA11074 [Gossypium barbadense]|uniref:F-box domain-containing protein n=1 Tax=Gossypium barbadense TaxID=3634 RepID=A0A2P5Y1U1_GOSBA|nr:hypothetical protein GOBAR_AA11074 [Gossypium barbadense]
MELPNSKMVKHDGNNGRDRISELPDDVLMGILSFLPPEEAVLKTSFLSHRWKQLWESLPVSGFNFRVPMPVCCRGGHVKNLKDLRDGKYITVEDMKRECSKFVEWVNNVMISHQGSTIDELRVRFYLDKDSQRYIDKWIEIAMRKQVKKLELDFPSLLHRPSNAYYPFPQECFPGIEFLTSLCLVNVGVSDEAMEFVLSNYPMLETLHLRNSPLLIHPKVSGSSLRLKHLNISHSESIQTIEISAPNLVSFEYHKLRKVPFHIWYAPKLSELDYSNWLDFNIAYLVSQLYNYLPQLVTLRLSLFLMDLPRFPKFTSLRNLTCITARIDNRLLLLKSLIQASPFLHKFKLLIKDHKEFKSGIEEAGKEEAQPNKYLKEVEIVGFLGQSVEVEFVTYLLKIAIKLEKIVIHGKLERMTQNLAHQLMKNRPGAELVQL